MSYQLLGKEIIYSGRVFDLARAHFRLPNGKEHTYDLVDHHGAVTILPVDERGNIWFVRQYRIGALDWLLELPAGSSNKASRPKNSARREVQEEIGMAAGKMLKLGEFYMVPGYSSEKLVAYLATELYELSLPQDEDEFLEREAIPVRQVYEMAQRGEIFDGKTLAALLMAQPHLQKFLD